MKDREEEEEEIQEILDYFAEEAKGSYICSQSALIESQFLSLVASEKNYNLKKLKYLSLANPSKYLALFRKLREQL